MHSPLLWRMMVLWHLHKGKKWVINYFCQGISSRIPWPWNTARGRGPFRVVNTSSTKHKYIYSVNIRTTMNTHRQGSRRRVTILEGGEWRMGIFHRVWRDLPRGVPEVDPDTQGRNNPCARARTICMREVALGMLVTYTHVNPRDDCPIRKIMAYRGRIFIALASSDLPTRLFMSYPSFL